jgi:hypothetical protein
MAAKASAAMLAEYFRDQARWRELKHEDWGDSRNLGAAKTLEKLAVYVESLPEDDHRLAVLRAADTFMDDSASLPVEASRSVGRYGFDSNYGVPSPDEFLTYLADDVAKERADEIAGQAHHDPEFGNLLQDDE